MYAEQSTFDWCRYGHWDTSAEKARLSAFLLWQTREGDELTTLQNEANYINGDARLAVLEGFRRESAVALELIIKAVIAEQFRLRCASESERVPITHDMTSPNYGWKLGFLNSREKTNINFSCSNLFCTGLDDMQRREAQRRGPKKTVRSLNWTAPHKEKAGMSLKRQSRAVGKNLIDFSRLPAPDCSS